LSGDLEEKDQALAKAREALHKAKLQKYQACSSCALLSKDSNL